MNRDVIPELVATIERSLDGRTARRFAALPRDARADAVRTRVGSSIVFESLSDLPHWSQIGTALGDAVQEREPDAIIEVPPGRPL